MLVIVRVEALTSSCIGLRGMIPRLRQQSRRSCGAKARAMTLSAPLTSSRLATIASATTPALAVAVPVRFIPSADPIMSSLDSSRIGKGERPSPMALRVLAISRV